jgi:hypothetical protein
LNSSYGFRRRAGGIGIHGIPPCCLDDGSRPTEPNIRANVVAALRRRIGVPKAAPWPARWLFGRLPVTGRRFRGRSPVPVAGADRRLRSPAPAPVPVPVLPVSRRRLAAVA